MRDRQAGTSSSRRCVVRRAERTYRRARPKKPQVAGAARAKFYSDRAQATSVSQGRSRLNPGATQCSPGVEFGPLRQRWEMMKGGADATFETHTVDRHCAVDPRSHRRRDRRVFGRRLRSRLLADLGFQRPRWAAKHVLGPGPADRRFRDSLAGAPPAQELGEGSSSEPIRRDRREEARAATLSLSAFSERVRAGPKARSQ
jgi:hypothetical protein